ncbi:MAG: hypothetical protein ACI4SC_01670, partial [Candidatus Neoclostridium sp.]
VRECAEENGLTVYSYKPGFDCLHGDFTAVLSVAAALGAKAVTVNAGDRSSETTDEETLSALCDNVSRYAELAKKEDIEFTVALSENTCCDGESGTRRLLERIKSKSAVRIAFKTLELCKGQSVDNWIQRNGAFIRDFSENVSVLYAFNRKNGVTAPLREAYYEWSEQYLQQAKKDVVLIVDAADPEMLKADVEGVRSIERGAKALREKLGYDRIKRYEKEELALALKSTHGSLDLTDEIERALKCDLNARMLEEIKAAADAFKNEQTPHSTYTLFQRYFIDGNRGAYESVYFKKRFRLSTFVLAALFFGVDEYLPFIENELWAVLNEYTWVLPAHISPGCLCDNTGLEKDMQSIDLFAAVTAAQLAEISFLLKDKLPVNLRNRIKENVQKRIFDVVYKDYWWKVNFPTNNWSAVCGGEVGIAALYLIDDEDELAEILQPTLNACINYCESFGMDGASSEGLEYWAFGFGMALPFYDMLARRTEGKINLLRGEKINNIASFVSKVIFDGELCVSFSDGSTRFGYDYAQMCKLQEYFPEITVRRDLAEKKLKGKAPVYNSNHFTVLLRRLIWTRETEKPKVDKAATYVFPDVQWYVSTSKNNVSFAAKASYNWESHNHLDVGTFEIFKNGEIILHDIGGGEYTAQYFVDEYRYSKLFCCCSRSHSVPVIDGHEQQNGVENRAENVTFNEDGMSFDMEKAYGKLPVLKKLNRRFVFDKQNGSLKITDAFGFTKKNVPVVERLISVSRPEIVGDKVIITAGNERAEISFGREATVSVGKEIDKNHAGADRTTWLIDFAFTANENKAEAEIRVNFD